MQQRTISNRSVAAITVERDTVFWDRIVTGFGVRVYPTGGKVYIAQARGPEGPKRVTVGRHGVLNADEARRRAALIVTRIKAGEDPVALPPAARARGGPTVADLASRYLEDHVEVRLKPRTQAKLRGVLRLPDAKSGPRAVQLPPPAVRLLEALPRRGDNPWVFPGRAAAGRYSEGGLDRAWRAVREAAKLEDVRIHDLRHSFASRALALGETLPVIGKLLGHNDIETTARYAHLAQDSVHEAAERIAWSIAADIL